MRKAIPLLFILLICCTTASASFMNLQVYPRETSIDAYPGQEISLDFEYSIVYSNTGDQKQIQLYETTESGQILLPVLYREYFSMEGLESINKSVPYTVSQDQAIGDKVYLLLTVYTKMSVGDGFSANDPDGYSIVIDVVEQPFADDDNVNIGDIKDYGNGAFEINNILIGILGILTFALLLRYGIPQMVFSNPIYLSLVVSGTIVCLVAVIV